MKGSRRSSDQLTNRRGRLNVLARLVTARTKGEWLSWRELLRIGVSKSYLGCLLRRLLEAGLIERRGPRGAYRYQASAIGHSGLPEGELPRTTLRRMKASERPRAQTVELRPISEFLDASAAWSEGESVSFQVDSYTGDAMRSAMNPPSPRDRARQYSASTDSFSVTISRRNVCRLVWKTAQALETFRGWLVGCGLSAQSSESVLRQIRLQLPDRFVRAEMPVLDRAVKKREVEFVISTRCGDDKIVSNINYSANIDFESFGTARLMDSWLMVLGATQHNQVVALEAMEQKIHELAEQVEKLRKEKEAGGKQQGGGYYV